MGERLLERCFFVKNTHTHTHKHQICSCMLYRKSNAEKWKKMQLLYNKKHGLTSLNSLSIFLMNATRKRFQSFAPRLFEFSPQFHIHFSILLSNFCFSNISYTIFIHFIAQLLSKWKNLQSASKTVFDLVSCLIAVKICVGTSHSLILKLFQLFMLS